MLRKSALRGLRPRREAVQFSESLFDVFLVPEGYAIVRYAIGNDWNFKIGVISDTREKQSPPRIDLLLHSPVGGRAEYGVAELLVGGNHNVDPYWRRACIVEQEVFNCSQAPRKMIPVDI